MSADDTKFSNCTATRTYTEREKVLAEREAIDEAVEWIFREARTAGREGRGGIEGVDARNLAATLRPLPKVTRPVIMRDPCGGTTEWAVIDGGMCLRGDRWKPWQRFQQFRTWSDAAPLADRVKMWACLWANPTEEVEDGA